MQTLPSQQSFLPNLFLLGAAKCGTTTLYAYLDQMPDICMASPKEPHFFHCQFERGLDFYRQNYFPHWKGERIIGEAQHRNLYLPFVPKRIHSINPDAKLLVIVRNPIERAHSHWNHYASRGKTREPLSFEHALQADLHRVQGVRPPDDIWAQHWAEWFQQSPDRERLDWPRYRTYLDTGYYYEQIQRYLALFPAKNLKVMLFEDMVANPKQVVDDVVQFLGLDPATNHWTEPIWRNAATPDGKEPKDLRVRQNWLVRKTYRLLGMKHRIKNLPPPADKVTSARETIDPKSRAWLREHYREHNRKLAEFLGRDLSAWD